MTDPFKTTISSLAPVTSLAGSEVYPVNQGSATKKATINQFRSAVISAAPSPLGNWNSIVTAFGGDISHIQNPLAYQITGDATLGQPTSGYVYTPEAYPNVAYLYNSSGYNHDTAGAGGRTAAVAYRVYVYQAGQGDAVAYNATAFVVGSRPGATDFLANPAASLFNGDMTAGSGGVYLNPVEVILHDAGYDVAGVGYVSNLDRNNAAGALGVFWAGFRAQSIGTVDVNAAYSVYGKFSVGLDLSPATLDSNKVAIALKANDRVYFETTSSNSRYPTALGDTYFSFDTSLGAGAWHLIVNNQSAIQAYSDQIISVQNIRTEGVFKVSTSQVVGPRSTGWSAMTGTADKATVYDTAAVTLAQLAGRVLSLQAALTTHGLIGI